MDGQKLVCFLTLVYLPSLCWAFGYTCYPDNTITVTGLGADTTSVFAKNSDGVNCTTSAPADTVHITNCDKQQVNITSPQTLGESAEVLLERVLIAYISDKYIVFAFGSYSNMLAYQIFGGSTITVVNITCNEIEPTGHTINNTFGARVEFNETRELTVTYNVRSELDKILANVGEQVVWSIYFPSEYSLEVDYCTANPGTSYDEATMIPLISNYCTESADLISDFSSADGLATATINAFKFYGNNNVFLRCLLMVCPKDSACRTSCHRSGKRQIHDTESSDKRIRSEIGQVLRIMDQNANGANPFSGQSITFIILIVLASLL